METMEPVSVQDLCAIIGDQQVQIVQLRSKLAIALKTIELQKTRIDAERQDTDNGGIIR